MQTVWMFPGQGAEEPGMGLALAARSPAARVWLHEASRVTGLDVPRALERGARALSRTAVLQPVLVAVGLASAESRDDLPDAVAGHSLGELTAACWAASLSPAEALELAALRGRLMEELAAVHPGGMLAVRDTDLDALERLAEQAPGEAGIAAINTEAEIVVSGDQAALDWICRQLPGSSTPLRVSGPWHSERMRPAVAPLRARLDAVFEGRRLRVPFVSAVRAEPVCIEELPECLADGLVRPVRFLEVVRHLGARGVDTARVVAPARTTRSLIRRAGGREWRIEDI